MGQLNKYYKDMLVEAAKNFKKGVEKGDYYPTFQEKVKGKWVACGEMNSDQSAFCCGMAEIGYIKKPDNGLLDQALAFQLSEVFKYYNAVFYCAPIDYIDDDSSDLSPSEKQHFQECCDALERLGFSRMCDDYVNYNTGNILRCLVAVNHPDDISVSTQR